MQMLDPTVWGCWPIGHRPVIMHLLSAVLLASATNAIPVWHLSFFAVHDVADFESRVVLKWLPGHFLHFQSLLSFALPVMAMYCPALHEVGGIFFVQCVAIEFADGWYALSLQGSHA